MDKHENKMGVIPIGRLLMTMSGPAIFSMLVNALYNIVDSIFVARLGEKALTAVSIVYPIQFLMIAVGVGTGVGINSLISRRLGARRTDDANKAASVGIKLGIFNWLIFAVGGSLFARQFVMLFTSDEMIVKQGSQYLTIITVFSMFIMVGLIIEKIFQSTGNMIFPMITMIVGAVINIILDPILIFGLLGFPKLGVIGAAIATVFAQFISASLGIFLLVAKDKLINIKIFTKEIDWHIVKEIYAVGGPTIVMQSIVSFMLFGINAILASFSATAVAVLGIYGKLQSFVFMPSFGVNQGAMPIMGYNYGAKNKKRLIDTFKIGTLVATIIMILGFALFQLAPNKLLGMFNASEDMYNIGIDALKIVSWSFIPAGFSIMASGLFGATGHGMISMWGALIRQFLGILPLAYIFGEMFGLRMVWAAFPLAEVIGVLYYALMLRYIYNKSLKRLGCEENE